MRKATTAVIFTLFLGLSTYNPASANPINDAIKDCLGLAESNSLGWAKIETSDGTLIVCGGTGVTGPAKRQQEPLRPDDVGEETRSRFELDNERCDRERNNSDRGIFIQTCFIYLWPNNDDDEIPTRLALADGYMQEYIARLLNGGIADLQLIASRGIRYSNFIIPFLQNFSKEDQVEFWTAFILAGRAMPNDHPPNDEKRRAIKILIELFKAGATNRLGLYTKDAIKSISPDDLESLIRLRTFPATD
ncbi:MAG: hypothetical protein HYW90_03880 [Candidatus Sungbacteria bacterium]|nr:hypothetical protein [Candidatus Sungbacteria bacterium]